MFLEVPSSGLLNNDDDEDDENCLSQKKSYMHAFNNKFILGDWVVLFKYNIQSF